MNETNVQKLIDLMVDLSSEIDGVVDLGITVCLLDDEKMAGRQQYLKMRSEKTCDIVDGVTTFFDELDPSADEKTLQARSELLAGCFLFLGGFRSLGYFRDLKDNTLFFATESLRVGWDTIHEAIAALAEGLGQQDASWFSAIIERNDTYRSHFTELFQSLQEVAGSLKA
jgi:hypothetical protein